MVSFDNGMRRLGGSALATREEVHGFLLGMRAALEKRLVLHPRSKNRDALAGLGWKPSDLKLLLRNLEVEDYADGPLPDSRGLDEEHWVFGPEFEERQLYVKLTVFDWGLLVLSFHVAEHPLKLPLK